VKYLDQFLNALTYQKGYSSLTCRRYREILLSWQKWWIAQGQSELAIPGPAWTEDSLREFLYHLRETRNYAPASLAQSISCFKSLDHYLLKSQITHSAITFSIRTPKKDQKLVDFISQDVLRVEPPEEMDEISLRRWALFEIFYGSGIRLAEIESLSWNDIQLPSPLIKVLGKGNKERFAPISSQAIQLLTRIAQSRGFELTDHDIRRRHTPIFLSTRGTPLSRSSIQRDIGSFLESLGWQGKASPHMLRHSFATHMMENGAEIMSVKELLGHSSVQSTQVYTHVTHDQIMKNFQQAHPRASKTK
jgi:integrase/recombinase XerC